MSARIEIYTRLYCAYCQRAKELLRIKGVNFVEHDITDSKPATVKTPQPKPTRAIPEIFINDKLIGGCAELFDLDERGELDVLLGLAFNSGESFRQG
jgi:glutaredoxin 3